MSGKTAVALDPAACRTVVARWSARVGPLETEQCVEWPGSIGSSGYGKVKVQGSTRKAHRVFYVAALGRDIGAGLEIDHVCNNPGCVNPRHMREATPRENTLAKHSDNPARINAEKVQCPRGHVLTGANLIVAKLARGERTCRACDCAHSAVSNAHALGRGWGDLAPTALEVLANAYAAHYLHGAPAPKRVTHPAAWINPVLARYFTTERNAA